ncbi:hypothetical protein [Amphibacillus jilinensis]
MYLSDPDNQINQVHIISQGSVGVEDWLDHGLKYCLFDL